MEKTKKKWYKKWWVLLIIVFVLGAIGSALSKDETEKAPEAGLATSENHENERKNEPQPQSEEIKPIITIPENIENIDFALLANHASEMYFDEWVRLAGKVTSAGGNMNTISFRDENIITFNIAKSNGNAVAVNDYVIIVGQVGSQSQGILRNTLTIENAIIEAVGDTAQKLHLDLKAGYAHKFIELFTDDIIIVSAVDLARDYRENEVRANNTYKGSWLVVTGEVANIGAGIFDSVFITLSDGVNFSFSNPQFSFDDELEKQRVAELNKGDIVTVLTKSTGEIIGTAMGSDSRFIF
jgi:hypothetical protein